MRNSYSGGLGGIGLHANRERDPLSHWLIAQTPRRIVVLSRRRARIVSDIANVPAEDFEAAAAVLRRPYIGAQAWAETRAAHVDLGEGAALFATRAKNPRCATARRP